MSSDPSPRTTGAVAPRRSHDAGGPCGRAHLLREACGVAVHLPGDPSYDAGRTPWNLAVDQRPAAVAFPADADEVAALVLAATASGLHVAPQGTGHNAGPLGDLGDTLLLRTSAMAGVQVDVVRRVARVGAGAVWRDVVEATAPHGLAALHGSSPDVGVVGCCLGGGIGWFARQHGLASGSVVAVELVLGDGRQVRADAEQHPDLFWAVRGGGGGFGVVTAIELSLLPVETAWAGMLVWDEQHAGRVLRGWAAWAATAPDCVTTSFRVLDLPPLPALPAELRGRRLVVVDGAVLAEDAEAAAALADLRTLGPELDTFARRPAADLVRLHLDQEGPTPGVSASALLEDLPEAAVEAFLAHTGPGSSLLAAELRQLGGALGRPDAAGGALPLLPGRFLLLGVAVAATPERAAQGTTDADALVDALAAWSSDGACLNFAERPVDVSRTFPADTWRRLTGIRSAVDPAGVVRANHPVPRLYENGPPTSSGPPRAGGPKVFPGRA